VSDMGNAADLEVCIGALEQAQFREQLQIASMLVARGRLLDVPVVFRVLETHRNHPDTDILWLGLSDVLCAPDEAFDQPSTQRWAEFRQAVAGRYYELWNCFGTNCVHVYQGRPLTLSAVIASLRDGIAEGFIDLSDRRLFEATTGFPCNHWFSEGRPNLLRAAADLEEFVESGRLASYPTGQRLFMGHQLEDVAAVERILATYPRNRGLDVPAIRATLEQDSLFELPLGLDPFEGGFFVRKYLPPPSADLVVDRDWPWLSFHTCLRAARAGRRDPLRDLGQLLYSVDDPMFRNAVVELLAAAADDAVLDDWRSKILTDEAPQLTFTLCWGLVQHGMLLDVPLLLKAYERHAAEPEFPYLEERFNMLLAFRPVRNGPHAPLGFVACRDEVTPRFNALAQTLGHKDMPIFRGAVFSVAAVAREILDLEHGPDLTVDLRQRFEGSTGIDCSDWELPKPDGYDRNRARDAAQRFLSSDAAEAFVPGQRYFFGRRLA